MKSRIAARSRSWILLALAGCSAGCLGTAFRCQTDEQCDSAPGGRCEATGYCSFPDGADAGQAACPSGRRYFGYSNELSSVCVGNDVGDGLAFEAEGGQISAPMVVVDDAQASGGQYVWSTVDSSGSVGFPMEIEQTGNYLIWCRVLAQSDAFDSFIVSVDDGAQVIYDTSLLNGQHHYDPSWQWTLVNDQMTTRVFPLEPGSHLLVFRAREQRSPLDRLIVTSDPAFVPSP